MVTDTVDDTLEVARRFFAVLFVSDKRGTTLRSHGQCDQIGIGNVGTNGGTRCQIKYGEEIDQHPYQDEDKEQFENDPAVTAPLVIYQFK